MLMKSLMCLAAFYAVEVAAKEPPKGVAAYWGQNVGGGQQKLKEVCDRGTVDTVILTYLVNFPEMKLDFGGLCTDKFDTGLLHCPDIGDDIRYCQSLGKTVLLSLGGPNGDYNFNDDAEAEAFAHVIYDTFGPGHTQDRPFDSAVVNGYDLNFKKGETGYTAFARELNVLHENVKYPYYLTATPTCYFPDETMGEMLKEVSFSAVFVQFYNDWCRLSGEHFNYQTSWIEYAQAMSPNPDISVYVGLPGNRDSATSGYADINEVKRKVTPDILAGPNFGGVALWDATSLKANKDKSGSSYDLQIKSFLNNPDFLKHHAKNDTNHDEPLMKKNSRFAIKKSA